MKKNDILWQVFKESGLTQRAFATKVGMDRPTNISLWLSGNQEISFKKLDQIVKCFGYELNVELIKKKHR